MPKLVQNAISGLLAALLFAMAMGIADHTELRIAEKRFHSAVTESNSFARK